MEFVTSQVLAMSRCSMEMARLPNPAFSHCCIVR